MIAKQPTGVQSLLVDDFLYFFLRLRKPRIRAQVDRIRKLHPRGRPEDHAGHIVDAHAQIALIAGTLFHAPLLLPGMSTVLRLLGLAGGASVLTRMHLYMFLEIAHLFGKDIDDTARVPEMMAVVAATGVCVAAPPIVLRALGLPPVIAIPAAGISASALTRLLGDLAIKHFAGEESPAASLAAGQAMARAWASSGGPSA